MTQEQANQQMDFMERYGPMLAKISGSVGVIIYGFVRVFFWGLVLWLTGRWLLKAPFGYLKGVEVAGLAGMIGVLGAIVALLLRVNFSNPMASPSLALTVGEFDPKNMLHVLLAMVDLFDLWQVGVMGAGLARLAGAPFARATLPVLVCWMVISAAFGALSSLAARFGS
jgi:hypothetical protein